MKSRLLWIGILLIALYTAIIASLLAYIGIPGVLTPEGFARFCAVALATSPLAIASLVLMRVALGRFLLAAIAAGSSITVLVRIARGEASVPGIAFAFGFLLVLLVIELIAARWDENEKL